MTTKKKMYSSKKNGKPLYNDGVRLKSSLKRKTEHLCEHDDRNKATEFKSYEECWRKRRLSSPLFFKKEVSNNVTFTDDRSNDLCSPLSIKSDPDADDIIIVDQFSVHSDDDYDDEFFAESDRIFALSDDDKIFAKASHNLISRQLDSHQISVKSDPNRVSVKSASFTSTGQSVLTPMSAQLNGNIFLQSGVNQFPAQTCPNMISTPKGPQQISAKQNDSQDFVQFAPNLISDQSVLMPTSTQIDNNIFLHSSNNQIFAQAYSNQSSVQLNPYQISVKPDVTQVSVQSVFTPISSQINDSKSFIQSGYNTVFTQAHPNLISVLLDPHQISVKSFANQVSAQSALISVPSASTPISAQVDDKKIFFQSIISPILAQSGSNQNVFCLDSNLQDISSKNANLIMGQSCANQNVLGMDSNMQDISRKNNVFLPNIPIPLNANSFPIENKDETEYLENLISNTSTREGQNSDGTFEFDLQHILDWVENLKEINAKLEGRPMPNYMLRMVMKARLSIFLNLHSMFKLPLEQRRSIWKAYNEMDYIYQFHYKKLCLE